MTESLWKTADVPRLILRIAWIVVRLLLALWLGERGLAFYYQGF